MKHSNRRTAQIREMADKIKKMEEERDQARAEAGRLRMALDKDAVLEVVRDWKHAWMAQKDNGYFERAFGIDANMSHDLARRLSDRALASTDGLEASAQYEAMREMLEILRDEYKGMVFTAANAGKMAARKTRIIEVLDGTAARAKLAERSGGK